MSFEELESKLGSVKGLAMFELINDVFDHLPLSCLVGKGEQKTQSNIMVSKGGKKGKVLAMHGGIGPNVETIAQISQGMKKPEKKKAFV